jgi:hypothetical protein
MTPAPAAAEKNIKNVTEKMRNSQRLPDKNQKPDLPFLINKIMPAVVLAVLSQKMFSAVSNAI